MKYFKIFRSSFGFTQEQIAKKLFIDKQTIASYEANRAKPSFKVMLKIISLYQISFDYFLLSEYCSYPRNLKLLSLAKKMDSLDNPEGRNNIENAARSLLGKRIKDNVALKKDIIDLELKKNFHANLKEVRKLRNLTQSVLAENIKLSRAVLAQYELRNYPSSEKLIALSNQLDISVHALATGEKLTYEFSDGPFGKTIYLADHFLSLKDHEMLIRLMEAILNNISNN